MSRISGSLAALVIVMGLAVAAGSARAADPVTLHETFDVAYHDESKLQRLDVFAPEGAKDLPVILFFHGGSWMFGDKDFYGLYRGVARSLAQQGVVVAMANYRLS